MASEGKKHCTVTTPLQGVDYESIGNSLNYVAFTVNLLMTVATLMRFPDPSVYDEAWQRTGFCVDFRDDRVVDTAILCFVSLVSGAIGLFFFNKAKEPSMDALLEHRMAGFVFANFSHGVGHLFLQHTNGMVPPLVFALDEPAAVAWVLVLLFFFTTVFRSVMIKVSMQQAFAMACAVVVLQWILDVPPDLSFTYSQAVILGAGFVDQLGLPSSEKQSVSYLASALYYFPIFALYLVESTSCSSLVPYGGHALYDTYLAVTPFLYYYTVKHYQGDGIKEKKVKAI